MREKTGFRRLPALQRRVNLRRVRLNDGKAVALCEAVKERKEARTNPVTDRREEHGQLCDYRERSGGHDRCRTH